MKQFARRIVLLLIPLVFIVPLWIVIVNNSEWNNFGFLKFQIDKLKGVQGRHYKTIYIGDSSGGYAMSTEGDSTTINLCLTGSYCFNGLISYVDVIDNFITYDTVVVIHSVDIPTRDVNEGVYWLPYLYSSSITHKAMAYLYSVQYAKGIVLNMINKDYFSVPDSDFEDYPIKFDRTPVVINKFTGGFKPGQIEDLKELNEKLKEREKKFCFLFGPTLPCNMDTLALLKDSIATYNTQHALNTPFPLDENSKGDSPDHVHPTYRDSATAYYSRLIRSAAR